MAAPSPITKPLRPTIKRAAGLLRVFVMRQHPHLVKAGGEQRMKSLRRCRPGRCRTGRLESPARPSSSRSARWRRRSSGRSADRAAAAGWRRASRPYWAAIAATRGRRPDDHVRSPSARRCSGYRPHVAADGAGETFGIDALGVDAGIGQGLVRRPIAERDAP